MKKLNKFQLIKFAKQLRELEKLGKKHDKESDPEKKERLKTIIVTKCNELKAEYKQLTDCSAEEALDFLGASINTLPASDNSQTTLGDEADEVKIAEEQANVEA